MKRVETGAQDRARIAYLLDFYGALLTRRQQEFLRLHCEEDLSLGEIATSAGISRQAVGDALTKGRAHLLSLEHTLGLCARHDRQRQSLQELHMHLLSGNTQKALQLLETILDTADE